MDLTFFLNYYHLLQFFYTKTVKFFNLMLLASNPFFSIIIHSAYAVKLEVPKVFEERAAVTLSRPQNQWQPKLENGF